MTEMQEGPQDQTRDAGLRQRLFWVPFRHVALMMLWSLAGEQNPTAKAKLPCSCAAKSLTQPAISLLFPDLAGHGEAGFEFGQRAHA